MVEAKKRRGHALEGFRCLEKGTFAGSANLQDYIIVEGQSRNTTKEYLYFLHNARGSVEEVRYFILLSKDLEFINDDIYQKIESEYETISKMLNGLIKSLKT